MFLKKSLSLLVAISMVASGTLYVLAAPKYQTRQEYIEDEAYQAVPAMKAKNITVNEETGVVTFQKERDIEGDLNDTNTYVIDEDTYIGPLMDSDLSFEDFISGKAPWADVFILKEDYEKAREAGEQRIHIASIGLFVKMVVGLTKDPVPVERLEGMGIIAWTQGGDFGPAAQVSRAELAQIMMAVYKDGGQYPDGGFRDVPASHPAYGAICGVRARGLMQGYGDGAFGPEDSVTIEQAAKLLVCALGYEKLAVQRGGYPDGYYAAAEEIGLMKGTLYSSPSTPAKRQDIASMVDNALSIPLMEEGGICDGTELPVKTLYTEYWAAK